MTLIYSLVSDKLHVSGFTLRDLLNSFLMHCEHHDIKADMYTFRTVKASHDQSRGEWSELKEEQIWIDPEEDPIYILEALK